MQYFHSKFRELNLIHSLTRQTIFLSCILAMAACSTTPSPQKLSQGIQKTYAISSTTANRISPLIIQNSQKHNVPATLIAAVIHQESSYRANAHSPSGAIGLMQIIPKYWQTTCPGDLYNEAININCGSYILAQYHQRAGDWNKALGYYNVGPSGYENNRNSRNSGKKYAKSVKKHEKALKRIM